MTKLLASLPVLAWLLSVSLTLCLRWLLNAAGAIIFVPLVSVSDSAGRDVVSDVTGFAVVVAWGLVCALLVEPTKAVAYLGRRRIAVYSLLLAYQIVLVADTIRAHAFDWWKWLLSLIGAVTLTTLPELQDVAGFRFPWLSCIVGITTAVVAFRSFASGDAQADTVSGHEKVTP